MSKKAQGLSINAIIVAAIALIVLVVLIAIFTGRLGIFSKGLGEATSCPQICSARGYGDSGHITVGEGSGAQTADPSTTTHTRLLGGLDSEGRQCWCQKS